MEPICGVPKILQKRIDFPTFVGGEGVKQVRNFSLHMKFFFEGIPYVCSLFISNIRPTQKFNFSNNLHNNKFKLIQYFVNT